MKSERTLNQQFTKHPRRKNTLTREPWDIGGEPSELLGRKTFHTRNSI